VAPALQPYRPEHLADLYDVCTRTGDAGDDATGKFSRPELLGHIYVGPYVEHEPELAFVLEDGGRAVGYALGTADTLSFVRWYRDEWLPRLSGVYQEPSEHPTTPDEHLLAVLHTTDRMWHPALAAYPAHLHIDILPSHQGLGFGRRLVEAFLDAARAAGAPAVHLGVAATNTRAQGFYRHLGFEELELGGASTGGLVLGRSTARD